MNTPFHLQLHMWVLFCLVCSKPLSFFFPCLFSTLYLARLNYTAVPSVFEAPLLTLGGMERNALKKSLLLLCESLLPKGNCSTLVPLCLKYSIKTTICSLTQVTKHAENERAHSGLRSCQAMAMCVSQDLIYEWVPPSQTCKRFKNMKFSERIKRITYLLALWGTAWQDRCEVFCMLNEDWKGAYLPLKWSMLQNWKIYNCCPGVKGLGKSTDLLKKRYKAGFGLE